MQAKFGKMDSAVASVCITYCSRETVCQLWNKLNLNPTLILTLINKA